VTGSLAGALTGSVNHAAAFGTLPATGALRPAWLLLAFPAFGALVLLLGGKRTNAWGHLLGCAMSLASFLYGVIIFVAMLGYPASQRSREVQVYTWIP